MQVALPPIQWSLVKAWKDGAEKPCRLARKKIEGFESMPLIERLRKTDEANEVFRFAYTQAEDDSGRKGRYYKIPLMRDYNIDIEKIKIHISKQEYERATAILEAAGDLQRITRAVPLSQIHQDVREYLAKNSVSLDDVAVVGIDRGGRVPTLVMKEILGQPLAYFLKVDQGGGKIDEERLEDFIRRGTFRDRFIIFVDSTVDSGRQIGALKSYFDNPEWAGKIGHRGWVVIGSNENGETLDHHLNINWGLNPDESFEDDPQLMGVDYADYCHTKIRPVPSKAASDIRAALRESFHGILLDFETPLERAEPDKMGAAWKDISRVQSSKTWSRAKSKSDSTPRSAEHVSEYPQRKPFEPERRSLAIFGSGSSTDLSDAEAEFLALALSPKFVFHAGTPDGNPGFFLTAVDRHCHDSNVTLYQPESQIEYVGEDADFLGKQIEFKGQTKAEFREALVRASDAVLVLGGSEGTLAEVLLSLHAGKHVFVVKNYGAVGSYLSSSRKYQKFDNLHLVDSLSQAAEQLLELKA